jgi:hypothetical protein
MFTSPASESKKLIDFPAAFDAAGLSEDQLAALDLSGSRAERNR